MRGLALFLTLCLAVGNVQASQYVRKGAETSYAFRNFVERLFRATDVDHDGWIRKDEAEEGSLLSEQMKDFPQVLKAVHNHIHQEGSLDDRDFKNLMYKLSPLKVVKQMEAKITMYHENGLGNAVVDNAANDTNLLAWGGVALRDEICDIPCSMPVSHKTPGSLHTRMSDPTCKFFVPRYNQGPHVACLWELNYGCVSFATDCSPDGIDAPETTGWFGDHFDEDGPYAQYIPDVDGYYHGNDKVWHAASAPAPAPAPRFYRGTDNVWDAASAPAPAPAPASEDLF